jgi:LysM repeat protein
MFGKLIGALLVVAVIWAVAARSSSGAGRPAVYTVRPYDTLWSIASAHYRGDTRAAVWKLRQRNGLDGATLRPGEKIVLP